MNTEVRIMHEKEMSFFFEGVRNTILSIVLVNGISLIFKSYTLYWILTIIAAAWLVWWHYKEYRKDNSRVGVMTWFLIPLYLVLVAGSAIPRYYEIPGWWHW